MLLTLHTQFFLTSVNRLVPSSHFSPLIFCFSIFFPLPPPSLSVFLFHASKELDGLTGRALETCYLPADPPKSLLPHWTVICPISGLFHGNWSQRACERERARSPVEAASCLRQLSAKKTKEREREREKQRRRKVWESCFPPFSMKKQLKWMQFTAQRCAAAFN